MKTIYFNLTAARNIKIIPLLILFFAGICWGPCSAQTDVWSATPYGGGGAEGLGSVFKLKTDGSDYTVCHSFSTAHAGMWPYYTTPFAASDNKLYGMTSYGGVYNQGVLFNYEPVSGQYTKLFDFRDTLGARPYGSLMQASDGKLYGMAAIGGDYGGGVIFSYDIVNHTYAKVLNFDGWQYGWKSFGTLLQASDGKLYGTTYEGGNFNFGVLFSFDITTGNCIKLFDFNYTDGQNPVGKLTETAAHKLYCLTRLGGAWGQGVIFEYDMLTGTGQQVQNLEYHVTGWCPEGSLLLAPNGLLYGGTCGYSSGGVLFSFDPVNYVFTHEHDFGLPGGGSGKGPGCDLLLGSDGNIYGTTSESIGGTLFCYDYVSGSFSTLFTLGGTKGYQPMGGLVEYGNGNLFGMGTYGGVAHGTFFSYQLSPGVFSKLFDFDDNNGAGCSGGLTYANGKLYGIAAGGSNNCGVAFSLDTGTFAYTNIHTFTPNADGPAGHLLLASDGNLYGTTRVGTIFSIDPVTGFFVNYSAFNNTTGRNCYGKLVQLPDGYIYGMTVFWGQHHDGTIFRFDPQTWTLAAIFSFDDSTSGKRPYGGLIEGSDGKLYGLTTDGGAHGGGVLFSYDAAVNSFVKLYDLDANSGIGTYGNMCQGPDGKIYGLTSHGGLYNGGTIICYDPATALFSKIFDFDQYVTGSYPQGSLFMASDSLLYGMTTNGGLHDNGVIFSLNTQTSTVTKLRDLDCPDGIKPNDNIFTEIPSTTVGLPKTEKAKALLTLAPVPAREKVRIVYTLPPGTKHAKLLITDVAGKIISTEDLNNASGYFDMPLTRFKAGAYVCNMTGKGVNVQKKMMVVD